MQTIKSRRARVNCSFNPRAAHDAFCAAMKQAVGVMPQPLIADGYFHDLKIKGGAKIWYVYIEQFDRARGHFGDWRTGQQFNWFSNRRGTSPMSAAEYQAMRQQINEQKLNDDANKIRIRKDVQRILRWTKEAPATHGYLVAKQIAAHGVHLYRGKLILAEVAIDNSLVIPIYDVDEDLQGIQFISENGIKRNLGPTSGGHFWIGMPRWQTLCVAEGFSTGASVKEAARLTCAVAFGAGGLMHVAQYVREQFNPKNLIVIADGDDVGRKAAHAAARATDALVFESDAGKDFNDMMREDDGTTKT